MASVAQFFKNADLLRLLCKKEYLPDLRDVARLASVNQRTRAVLAGTPDLVLCREIRADPDIIDPHIPYIPPPEEGQKCDMWGHMGGMACSDESHKYCRHCDDNNGKIACKRFQWYAYALYEMGNLRVARTFENIAKENRSTLRGYDNIDLYSLLEHGHFETALECALTQNLSKVNDECGNFFYFAMATLYDKDLAHLAEQRLLETCKLFRRLSREVLHSYVSEGIYILIGTHGVTEKVFLLLERKIGNVFLETAEFMQEMTRCLSSARLWRKIQEITRNNADGLAYLVRTKKCSLREFATALKDRIDELDMDRFGKNVHCFLNVMLSLLSQMHLSNCGTEAEWRSFFLSAEMQAVSRRMLKATAFLPLTAEMLEERDDCFKALMENQRNDNPDISFIDVLLEESANRTAMDRYIEFVAARLRDGLIEQAETESQNKKQKF